MSDNATNTAYALWLIPANISLSSMKTNCKDPVPGVAARFGNSYVVSPYYSVYEDLNDDNRNRFIGFASAEYQFTKGFSAQLRAGLDYGNTDFQANAPVVHYQYSTGRLEENNTDVKENNNDILLKWAPTLKGDFSLNVNAGANNRN